MSGVKEVILWFPAPKPNVCPPSSRKPAAVVKVRTSRAYSGAGFISAGPTCNASVSNAVAEAGLVPAWAPLVFPLIDPKSNPTALVPTRTLMSIVVIQIPADFRLLAVQVALFVWLFTGGMAREKFPPLIQEPVPLPKKQLAWLPSLKLANTKEFARSEA